MAVDIIGVEAVANAIELTNYKYFQIYRLGAANGSFPLYELSDSKTSKDAKENFIKWTKFILPTHQPFTPMPEYEIICFDAVETEENNGTEGDTKKYSSKKKKCKFSFALKPYESNIQQQNNMYGQPNNGNTHIISGPPITTPVSVPIGFTEADIEKKINDAVAIVRMEFLKSENDELKKHIEDLENELDEAYEEENEVSGPEENVNGNAQMLQAVSMLTGKPIPQMPNFQAQQPTQQTTSGGIHGPVNNATETKQQRTKEEKIANLNKACARLARCNADIDLDLLKFADLAEYDKTNFEMAINHIRSLTINKS